MLNLKKEMILYELKNLTNRGGAARPPRKGEKMRRELAEMPFDREFDGISCHATGFEVCDGNPLNPADLWNEYTDTEGNLYYGR